MMFPEELHGTQAYRALQKEQERERRRLRDRQRRQSMTIEERERHLARRRRNYQLRRQRTEGKQLDSQHIQTSSMCRDELKVKIESQPADVLLGGGISDDSSFKTNEDIKRAMVCEAIGYEVANFPRRLRVKQIRHLARLLNSPRIGVPSDGNQQKADEQSITRNSESRNSLRLIHVKRLARALNSTMGRISDQTQAYSRTGMAQIEHQQQYSQL